MMHVEYIMADGIWRPTPAWHPRRWFGYTWRLRVWDDRWAPWMYDTDIGIAKRHLEMEFG